MHKMSNLPYILLARSSVVLKILDVLKFLARLRIKQGCSWNIRIWIWIRMSLFNLLSMGISKRSRENAVEICQTNSFNFSV